MNIYNNAKPRTKMAILLITIVIIIMGCSFWENRLITDMNRSVSSIYKDRLVPASELFHINDLMYSKRLALEEYLAAPATQQPTQLQQQLASYNAQIYALMSDYESTYLVEKENRTFQDFKKKVKKYNTLEHKILVSSGQLLQPAVAEEELTLVFTDIHKELLLLSDIQLEVGHELLNGSETIKGSASILSNLQIAIVLLITIAVLHVLILEKHPLIPKNLKNFRLN